MNLIITTWLNIDSWRFERASKVDKIILLPEASVWAVTDDEDVGRDDIHD